MALKIKKTKKRFCVVKPLKTKDKVVACFGSRAAAQAKIREMGKRSRKAKRKTKRRTKRRR
jgi:hypothetical protein